MSTHQPNLEDILSQLTLKEKVSLTSAESWWRTEIIRRGDKILVPHIKVSTRQIEKSTANTVREIETDESFHTDNRWPQRGTRRKLCQRHQVCLLSLLYLYRCHIRCRHCFPGGQGDRKGS